MAMSGRRENIVNFPKREALCHNFPLRRICVPRGLVKDHSPKDEMSHAPSPVAGEGMGQRGDLQLRCSLPLSLSLSLEGRGDRKAKRLRPGGPLIRVGGGGGM